MAGNAEEVIYQLIEIADYYRAKLIFRGDIIAPFFCGWSATMDTMNV